MEVMYILAKASHATAVYFTRPEKCKAPVGSHPDRKTEASLECSKWKVLGSRNYWQAGNEGWEAPSNYLHHLLHENGWFPALSPQLLGTSTTSEKPQENHACSFLLSKSSCVSLADSPRMTWGKGVWGVKVQVSAPRCREGYRRGINYGELLKVAVGSGTFFPSWDISVDHRAHFMYFKNKTVNFGYNPASPCHRCGPTHSVTATSLGAFNSLEEKNHLWSILKRDVLRSDNSIRFPSCFVESKALEIMWFPEGCVI